MKRFSRAPHTGRHSGQARTARVLALAVLFCLLLPMLAGCPQAAVDGNGVSVPAGMQNATGAGVGYHYFVPSDWYVVHAGGLTTATVSVYSTASLTLAVFESEHKPGDYWAKYQAELLTQFTDFTLADGAPKGVTLGGKPAFLYEYSGTYYTGTAYSVKQLIAKHGERLFILTYTARTEEFENYSAAVDVVYTDFVFTDGEGTGPDTGSAGSYENAPAGYRQISDDSFNAYRLFVPDAWRTAMQSGVTAAYVSDADRSSISMTCQYPPSGIDSLDAYFDAQQTTYAKIYNDYTVLSRPAEGTVSLTVGGRNAYRYQMRGTKNGVTYRIEQVLFVRDSYIYTFTYTATDALFDTHRAEVDAILANIVFP